jgi:hypothetical protein
MLAAFDTRSFSPTAFSRAAWAMPVDFPVTPPVPPGLGLGGSAATGYARARRPLVRRSRRDDILLIKP